MQSECYLAVQICQRCGTARAVPAVTRKFYLIYELAESQNGAGAGLICTADWEDFSLGRRPERQGCESIEPARSQ